MKKHVVHVDVRVGADGIVCSPDPVKVTSRNALVNFHLKSDGYRFRDKDAIVVYEPQRDFPYPSWTVKPTQATLLDLDNSTASYAYSVYLVDTKSGKEVSVDPTIENRPE